MARAQAAIEYLTTYGWALLILVAALGALLYFGIIDAGRLAPSHCAIEAGLYCQDFRAGADSLTFVLFNSFAAKLADVNVSVVTDDGSCNGSVSLAAPLARSTASAPIVFCQGTQIPSRVRGRIGVEYRFEDETVTHAVNGDFAMNRE